MSVDKDTATIPEQSPLDNAALFDWLKKDENTRDFLLNIVFSAPKFTTLEQKINELEKEYKKNLHRQVEDKNKEIASLGVELSTRQRELQAEKDKNQKLQGELGTWQGELKAEKANSQRLQGELNGLREKLEGEKDNSQKLQGKLGTWQGELQAEKDKNQKLQGELNGLREKLGTCQGQLEAEKDRNQKLLTAERKGLQEKEQAEQETRSLRQKYETFGELEKAYEMYRTLPQEIRKPMSGFIRGDSLFTFVVSGMRDSQLDRFWEFCRMVVQEPQGNEIAPVLSQVFTFFFDKMNSVTEFPLYELRIPETGVRYDDEKMILSNNSKVRDGFVDQVILPGYYAKANQKTIKKTVVLLKGAN
jgi:hypothetical protein